MEWDYTPPRGFTNPLAKNGAEEEKRGGKKAMSTAAAHS